jgi:2-amino-4-hydroxy-6-hydroxymethyldihydropteridine diphosphokinase
VNDAPVVVALGSNLGDRAAHLRAGILGMGGFLHVERVSRVIETPPWGAFDGPPQGAYLNVVAIGHSSLPPEPLLDALLEVERSAGRVRDAQRNAPRTLDLDLIFHGARVWMSPRLIVPHPRWHLRAFVVRPLLDLLPRGIDPESGLPLVDRVAPEVLESPWVDRGPLFEPDPGWRDLGAGEVRA